MAPSFHLPSAATKVPDGEPFPSAIARTTHLGIGAHQDDLEFMAFHGILACYDSATQWFGGVTCTNGVGSARAGALQALSASELGDLRKEEQDDAAEIGRYSFMTQLDYPSEVVKNPSDQRLREDLLQILLAARPEVVYMHNLADKHDSHIGVAIATLQALRDLPPECRPKVVHGCEGWRGLDWLDDATKVIQDVSGHDYFADNLNRCFGSQIDGGKRYDLAVMGRRRANATFLNAHQTDAMESACYAMDLTPLIEDPQLDISAFVTGHIRRFEDDVRARLQKRLG